MGRLPGPGPSRRLAVGQGPRSRAPQGHTLTPISCTQLLLQCNTPELQRVQLPLDVLQLPLDLLLGDIVGVQLGTVGQGELRAKAQAHCMCHPAYSP